MSSFRQGRYSWLIRPIFYIIDLTIINVVALLWLFPKAFDTRFLTLISLGWIITALISKFYEVHRYSSVIRVFNLIIRQGLFFTLLMFAYEGIFPQYNINPKQTLKYILVSFILISFFKYTLFFLLKHYRAYLKGNTRKTIILGDSKQAKNLEEFFNSTPESGFINTKVVSFKNKASVDLTGLFEFIKNKGLM